MLNEFEKSQDRFGRRSAEGRELSAEQKEKQAEEAEKKMAAKERVEVVAREVKNTKQQIQNIVANMAQVVKLVAQIRAQLQVAHDENDIPSVKRDKKVLDDLKKKLEGLYGEIKDLKKALLVEESKAAREENPTAGAAVIEQEATRRVDEILMKLGVGWK